MSDDLIERLGVTAKEVAREHLDDVDNCDWAEIIRATYAPMVECIAALEANLEGRDKFIVDRGLWSDFVASLTDTGENCE